MESKLVIHNVIYCLYMESKLIILIIMLIIPELPVKYYLQCLRCMVLPLRHHRIAHHHDHSEPHLNISQYVESCIIFVRLNVTVRVRHSIKKSHWVGLKLDIISPHFCRHIIAIFKVSSMRANITDCTREYFQDITGLVWHEPIFSSA